MFRRILIAIDGSDASSHALDRGLKLAASIGASVHAISIEERLPAYAATVGETEDEERFESAYFRNLHRDAQRLADSRGVAFSGEIRPGHAADAIVRAAQTGEHDLIVLGHTGHSRLHHLLLGSTADRVVEHAPCPVLVVR